MEKWTQKINLISRNSVPEIWSRHVLDSAQLYEHAAETDLHWVDLGSGGGLPAIVCAILAKGQNRSHRFTLVESDQRKATFLRAAIRELELNAKVEANRAESLPHLGADVLSARALAPLTDLLSYAFPHISSASTLILPKGREAEKEISEAKAHWRFKLERHPSITDPESTILIIGDVARV